MVTVYQEEATPPPASGGSRYAARPTVHSGERGYPAFDHRFHHRHDRAIALCATDALHSPAPLARLSSTQEKRSKKPGATRRCPPRMARYASRVAAVCARHLRGQRTPASGPGRHPTEWRQVVNAVGNRPWPPPLKYTKYASYTTDRPHLSTPKWHVWSPNGVQFCRSLTVHTLSHHHDGLQIVTGVTRCNQSSKPRCHDRHGVLSVLRSTKNFKSLYMRGGCGPARDKRPSNCSTLR